MGRTRSMRLVARRALVWCAAAACAVSGLAGCLQILGVDGTYVAEGGGGTGGTTSTGATGGTGGATGGTTSSGECQSGMSEECYSGPVDTKDVGICHGGTRTCGEDGTWGICEGEQTPQAEDPTTYGDEACDGYASQEVAWSTSFGGPLAQGLSGLTMDPTTGDVLVAGYYDADGPIDILGTMLQPPPSQNVFPPGFLARFGSDGTVKSAIGPIPSILKTLVTPSGDVVVVGEADGNSPLGGQTLSGLFVGRLNNGGTFDWVRNCACFLTLTARATLAKDGNVLVFGSFSNSIDWLGEGISYTSTGKKDLILSELDVTDGHVVWTEQFGGVNDEDAAGLTVDPAGNIFVATRFDGTETFVGSKHIFSDGDGASSLIAKLAPDGTPDWTALLSGPNDQSIQNIAAGPTGEIVTSGSLGGDMTVDSPLGNDLSIMAGGLYDLFLLSLDATGEAKWGRSLGPDYGSFYGLGIAQNGDIFGAGLYTGAVDLGGGALPVAVTYHGFVGRLRSDGTQVWSKDFGSVDSNSPVLLDVGASTFAVGAAGDGSVDFGDAPHITVGPDVAVAVIGQ